MDDIPEPEYFFSGSDNLSGLSALSEDDAESRSQGSAWQEHEIPEGCVAIELERSIEFIRIDEEMTIDELKRVLEDKAIEMEGFRLYYDERKLDEREPAKNYENRKLVGRYDDAIITLRIHDLDSSHPLESVKNTNTIKMIKAQLSAERGVEIHKLSFRGEELDDNDALVEKKITNETDVLVSRIAVTVADELCDSVQEIHAYEFWTLEQLINEYCEKQQREFHDNAELTFNEQQLSTTSRTLYMLEIKQGCVINYKVPPFPVRVLDTEDLHQNPEGITIEIEDSWTIDKVKTTYERESQRPFLDDDRILFLGTILDATIPVWRLRIGRNQELVVERERQTRQLPYICTECGYTVPLKSQDAVQCRNCFSKILYKKRTTRACQYDCR